MSYDFIWGDFFSDQTEILHPAATKGFKLSLAPGSEQIRLFFLAIAWFAHMPYLGGLVYVQHQPEGPRTATEDLKKDEGDERRNTGFGT